jgi:flagellar hook assembly protein FlgD
VSRTVGVTVQVRPADRQTLAFGLAQNSPNPFSGSTTIGYSLGRPSRVTIKLYTIAGERVATLVDRDQDAGRYALTWSGVDQRGRPLPAGLYLYRLQAGPHRTTRKLVIR